MCVHLTDIVLKGIKIHIHTYLHTRAHTHAHIHAYSERERERYRPEGEIKFSDSERCKTSKFVKLSLLIFTRLQNILLYSVYEKIKILGHGKVSLEM